MKRIITALGNNVLNDELKRYSKYDIACDDIFYQEGVIDFLEHNNADILVISGLLQGELKLIDFVDEIKKRNFGIRIILIVDNISSKDENILISKGIFDILRDSEIDVPDVIEAIDREEPINVRAQIEKEAKAIKSAYEKSTTKEESNYATIIKAVQKQEIIGFFGTAGSGKSTLCANFTKAFAKKTKAKILLVDFDTLNGNLDEILNVSKIPPNIELIIDEDKKCGLNYAIDLMLKNRFDPNVLDEVVINCGDYDFLSGNTSLHYCQNVLNEEFYDYLLKCIKEKYDFIILDLSSNLFLDSTKWALKECTNVIFVTENTNVCLKKSLQQLEVVFDVWNVYKEKFNLVLNRITNTGIDEDIFAEAAKLRLIGSIKEKMAIKEESYDNILSTLDYVPKEGVIRKLTHNFKLLSATIAKI